jgi:hypothetical protein
MVDVDRVGGVRDGGVRANFTFQLNPNLTMHWTGT